MKKVVKLLPFLLALFNATAPILSNNVLNLSSAHNICPSTNSKELAALVQHFGFISAQVVTTATKTQIDNASLSQTDQKIVNKVQQTYMPMIEKMRSLLFSNDPTLQSISLETFGNYILSLCNEFNIRNKYFMKLPLQLSSEITLEQQIALIKEAIGLLDILFAKIKPMPPLPTRIANILFYNFVSTKICPKIMRFGIGPILTLVWGDRNSILYQKARSLHPHKDIFNDYVVVEHNKEITWTKQPNLIEFFLGMSKEKTETINPCQIPNNICNVKTPPFADKLNFCIDQCSKCYQHRGIQSPSKIAASLFFAMRPLIGIPIFWQLGKLLEEIQLPKYENRLKQKEKIELEKKIQAEMRTVKVNYEQHIGFDQIKGQKDLIDREMRMIVDYLKNPLRYKNSASGSRSILFYGPPGTGKTLMARAIAKESGAPFLEITADDILHDNSKEKILATIRLAHDIASKRSEKSAIIYIDEIDCVTGNRQDGTLDPQRAKALSNLLSIFDGIEKQNPFVHLVIIITTNHYKNLDPALLRPGRIDRKILITPPNVNGRLEFFDSLLLDTQKHLADWLVKESNGFSGAQIVNIIDTAQMIASYAGRNEPLEEDYRAALQNCKAEYSDIPESTK